MFGVSENRCYGMLLFSVLNEKCFCMFFLLFDNAKILYKLRKKFKKVLDNSLNLCHNH